MGRDWQNEVLGFSFADPWVLLVVPLVLAIWWWRLRRRGPALGFVDVDLLASLPRTSRMRFASLPLHLVALGLLPVCLALARPQRLSRVPLQTEGIDILIAIDLSGSMAEQDMDLSGGRTRLDVVKDVAKRFIQGRVHDRIGLVSFARYPDLVCPVTLDHEAVKRFLEPLQHRSNRGRDPENRTAIGRGLALCVKRLKGSKAKSKVVILLTDGQENVGDILPAAAAKLAKDSDIRVYTIGAGRGQRVPPFGEIRKPDFSDLRKIAEVTGGEFYEAETDQKLDAVFARIDKLERDQLEDPIYIADELFFPLLAIGTLLLSAGYLMRLTWLVEVP